jgi:hypothetical protein
LGIYRIAPSAIWRRTPRLCASRGRAAGRVKHSYNPTFCLLLCRLHTCKARLCMSGMLKALDHSSTTLSCIRPCSSVYCSRLRNYCTSTMMSMGRPIPQDNLLLAELHPNDWFNRFRLYVELNNLRFFSNPSTLMTSDAKFRLVSYFLALEHISASPGPVQPRPGLKASMVYT